VTNLFYFSYLIGFIIDGENLWLVDSGASRSMMRDCDKLTRLMERRLYQKVELGDSNRYTIKGIGRLLSN